MEEIDGYHVLSLGFAHANIAEPARVLHELRSANEDADVQLVKAELVAGPEHLRFAAENAIRSFTGKNPRSKSLAVELLLYLSCQRQISKAIKLLGVGSADRKILLVALSKRKEAIQDLEKVSKSILGRSEEELVEIDSKQKLSMIQRSYNVSKRELDAARFEGESDVQILKRLIVERSALVDLQD